MVEDLIDLNRPYSMIEVRFALSDYLAIRWSIKSVEGFFPFAKPFKGVKYPRDRLLKLTKGR